MSSSEQWDPALRARLEAARDEWFRVGTSTEPADRPRAEAAISRLYQGLGKDPPRFLWAQSPPAAYLMMRLLGGRSAAVRGALSRPFAAALRRPLGVLTSAVKRAPFGDLLWDQLLSTLCVPLRRSIRFELRDFLRGAIRAILSHGPGTVPRAPAWPGRLEDACRGLSFGGSRGWGRAADRRWVRVRDAIEAEVEAWPVGGPLPATEHRLLWIVVGRQLGLTDLHSGQQDAYWIGPYLFARDVLGIPYMPDASRQLDDWGAIARSCSWWWPYRGLCLACERPERIRMPGASSPEHPSVPAVRFRDGWSIRAINGVRRDEGGRPRSIFDDFESPLSLS